MDTETTGTEVTVKYDTREAWLRAAADMLWDYMVAELTPLAEAGKIPAIAAQRPEIHVSVGFPTGRTAIGECWPTVRSADSKHHVFISPVLSDIVEILATLLHELVHVWDEEPRPNRHAGPFTKAIRKLKLAGKPTATTTSEELTPILEKMAEELGPFGHGQLTRGVSLRKPQTTRMLKLVCPVGDCDEEGNPYVKRTTKKWLDRMTNEGVWETCPFHGEEMDLG